LFYSYAPATTDISTFPYTTLFRSRESKLTLTPVNPRDFTTDRHGTVDDRPFGGGPGMVMKIEPLAKALASAKSIVGEDALVVYRSEEHTSELQSRFDIVCRLPREK